MNEEWRIIEPYPDYAVSSHGRVKRRESSRLNNGNGAGRILKQSWARSYRKVTLCVRGGSKPKNITVHSLVLEAFVGKRPTGHFGNHINGIKTDNHIQNLEWVTPGDNNRHAHKIGLVSHLGEKNPPAKLKDGEVWLIKKLLFSGIISQRNIAKMFKVHFKIISSINREDSWKHVRFIPGLGDERKNICHHRHKLHEGEIWLIRRLLASERLMQKEIAAMFKINKSVISRIASRKTWLSVVEVGA